MRRSRSKNRGATFDWDTAREDYPFWTLLVFLSLVFLMGGSGRDDVLSLILLRPLAVVALAVGLFGLTREEIRAHRGLLMFGGALIGLIALHLVPLPPSIWASLPGRDLAREAGEVAGIAQPWRPLSLIPWRGWNSLFAALVPLAALVLAIRCTARQREHLLKAVLILVAASMLWAIAQVASGYASSLSLYRITNPASPTGLYANRNHFAALICSALPMLAFLAARDGGERGATQLRWWLIAAIGCAAIVLLLVIGSRSGIVLAFVGLALGALILARGRSRAEGRGRWLAIAAGGAALGLVVALTAYLARAEALERLFAEGDENRLATWGPIAQMIWAYFPFGSGIGSFVDVYRVAEPRELLHLSYLNHAHNDWLEWPLETGLPGLALLLGAVIAWVAKSTRLLTARPEDRAARLALVGAAVLLILALASIADYPTRAPSIACLAAIAAVWMASWRGPAARSRTADAEAEIAAPPPSRRWGLRAALVGVGGLALAYFAFAGALTNIAHRRNPALALRFSPDDPVALAVQANARFAQARGRADADTLALARRSLAGLAINPAALQVIGFAATAEGGVAAGRPAMLLAGRMSRHDIPVQLWLIEEAVSRNAIPDALGHYDAALRTSEESQPLLLPVLTGALENEYMWPYFAPYIREPAPWLGAFTRHAVRNSRRPELLGRMFAAAGGLPDDDVFRSLESDLLLRLADNVSLAEAARLHRTLRGADASVQGRIGFDAATTDARFAPFTWQFYVRDGVNSGFVASESGSGLELHATVEAGAASPIARKAALLPAGRYRLAAVQRLAVAAEGVSVTWTLRCGPANGRVLWTATSALTERPARALAEVTVPAECAGVTLQLLAAPGPNGAEVVVSAVSFDRIG